MSNYKNTQTYERFNRFLKDVKKAKTDEEILKAGHALVDDWSGFHYNHIALSALGIIKKMCNPQCSQSCSK